MQRRSPSDASLRDGLDRTIQEWQSRGRDDPLYHVASWEGKAGAWTDADFYDVGKSDWGDFRAQWTHYWPELGGTCLEIGCGTGRITHVLAQDFERVVALDVSPEMITLARRITPDNTEFRQVTDLQLPVGDNEVDAVFFCHVFQHLDSFTMVAHYFSESRRVLRRNGSIMVHLLFESRPASLPRRMWREAKVRRAQRAFARGKNPAHGRTHRYQPETIRQELERVGFIGVELREFATRSNEDPHSFWFARK